jgi:hypothetical protein
MDVLNSSIALATSFRGCWQFLFLKRLSINGFGPFGIASGDRPSRTVVHPLRSVFAGEAVFKSIAIGFGNSYIHLTKLRGDLRVLSVLESASGPPGLTYA